jgi:hypothetical protein
MRPTTLPLCTRLAVFWHRRHVGAYIFDCVKHTTVFDRQRSSEAWFGDARETAVR